MKLSAANLLARLRHERAGFSLIELLMAIVFIGIGVVAVAGLFPLATKNVNDGKLLSTALGRAQEKLEDLEVAGFSSAVMTPGNYTDTLGTYVRTWAVQDSVPNDGTKMVTVSVGWPTNRGGEHVTLVTYVAR
jgi:prepilin-type N-terminal cleavage/methylation domain-containing protein